MGIKYYYSAAQQIRTIKCIADANGNILYEFENSTFVKNLPKITVCTVLDGKTFSVGFATCSSKDQYSGKMGRKIALARALNHPYYKTELEDIKSIHDVTNTIVNEIFDKETKRIYHVSDRT